MARGRGRWSEKITDAEYFDRLKSRVKIDADGCWLWRGFVNPGNGYGEMSYRNSAIRVHRLAFKLAGGNLRDDLDVCHSCDKPTCCNPAHLWQGTAKENMRDCSQKKRIALQRVTHCPRGHEYTEENTKVTYANGHRMRHCRLCNRIRNRLNSGWTLEQAMSLPPTPPGRRVVKRRTSLNGEDHV